MLWYVGANAGANVEAGRSAVTTVMDRAVLWRKHALGNSQMRGMLSTANMA